MTKLPIDLSGLDLVNIGLFPDDGTGDNLRNAFTKTNNALGALIYDLTTGFTFNRLNDTPEFYLSNAIVTVNSNADGLVHRSISNTSSIDVVMGNTSINFKLADSIGGEHTFLETIHFLGDITVAGNTIVRDTFINVEVFETENRVVVANVDAATSTTTGHYKLLVEWV